MSANLVIVESPAKAKTIEKFLGSGFVVKSSIGHIRDMPKKGMGIDIENRFQPSYEISSDKRKIVSDLKKAVKQADKVWLATDGDREGEAIAWHLMQALNLPDDTARIIFHEITKSAINQAISAPKIVNQHLVDAQQARRVLDRLVGFEISPVLWRKVSGAKSAGRVQSPVVRLVVERERQIEAFVPVSAFKVSAELKRENGESISVKLKQEFTELVVAETFVNDVLNASLSVGDIETKPLKRSPPAPFITSTLQQEASQKLGFSVKQTMTLAQNLYRNGNISYMRTDSVTLSEEAVAQAKTVINSQFGAEFSQARRYQNKGQLAQEAHEAIRPTDLSLSMVSADDKEAKLYKLIYNRTLASQMRDAELTKTNINIPLSNRSEVFQAQGEVVTFAGFLKIYDDVGNKDKRLPSMALNEKLTLDTLLAKETFTRPKSRYTEASLVREIEKRGIGRPSTFANMVSTVQDRNYVVKDSREGKKRLCYHITIVDNIVKKEQQEESSGMEKHKLFPTHLAYLLTDFLSQHFNNIVDYDFTAKLEDDFDKIAHHQKEWQSVIEDFYTQFHPKVEAALQIPRDEVLHVRELGVDPKSGRDLTVRFGRYGAFAQIGRRADEEKPVFAALKKDQHVDTITFEEALVLFELPRLVGETAQGEQIKANYGRFGPYLQYGKKFVSLKEDIPEDVTLEKAQELIAAKEKLDAERIIKTFDDSDIQVLNGRFGPYIWNGLKKGKGQKNVTIKKVFGDLEPKALTFEQCQKALSGKLKAKTPARKKTPRKSKRA